MTGLSERNLHRLRADYGENMPKDFLTTDTEGRPDKGMPVWSEALDISEIKSIYKFRNTIQSDRP